MDTKVHSYGNGNFGSATRHTKVYELKGADLVYQIDDCGSFQSGKFDAGQSVDYRVTARGSTYSTITTRNISARSRVLEQ